MCEKKYHCGGFTRYIYICSCSRQFKNKKLYKLHIERTHNASFKDVMNNNIIMPKYREIINI